MERKYGLRNKALYTKDKRHFQLHKQVYINKMVKDDELINHTISCSKYMCNCQMQLKLYSVSSSCTY